MSLWHSEATYTLNDSGKCHRYSGAQTCILWAALSTRAQDLPGKRNLCLGTVTRACDVNLCDSSSGTSTNEAPAARPPIGPRAQRLTSARWAHSVRGHTLMERARARHVHSTWATSVNKNKDPARESLCSRRGTDSNRHNEYVNYMVY